MADQWLTDERLDAQIEFLGGTPPARITLTDWVQRQLIPRPRGGVGGRGKRREYHPATAAELHAGMALLHEGDVPRAQLRYVREIALFIENCQTPQDVLSLAHSISRASQGRDISKLGPDVVFWLRIKRKALRELYAKSQPENEKQRDQYFDSQDFVRLMFGISNKLFDAYRFEGNRLVAPEKKMVAEAAALRSFPKAA